MCSFKTERKLHNSNHDLGDTCCTNLNAEHWKSPLYVYGQTYFQDSFKKKKKLGSCIQTPCYNLAACSGKGEGFKWDPHAAAVRPRSAFALGRVRMSALPYNNLLDKQTIKTQTNKQILPRPCAHGIHIQESTLKSDQCNASKVTGINVKTSAGDSSQTDAGWLQLSAVTVVTLQDFLPDLKIRLLKIKSKISLQTINIFTGSWGKCKLQQEL